MLMVEPRNPIEGAQDAFEELTKKEMELLVIAGDLNVKHQAWKNIPVERTGIVVMDLISIVNLEITNDPDTESIFIAINEKHWIDVAFTRG